MKGLQLYTIRKLTTDDVACEKAIAQVAKTGYECVQLAGSMETMGRCAAACKKIGLPIVGILADLKLYAEAGDALFDFAREYGVTDIGISSSARTEEQAKELIRDANRYAAVVRANGFSFSYHNHSHEFIRTACGKTVMELLLEGFDPDLVDLMPDTYWLQHGGADVRAFLEAHRGRVKILHLKDMKRVEEGPTFAELGVGNLNLEGIIATAKACGVEHFIVEQDKCDGDPLVSAEISHRFLSRF